METWGNGSTNCIPADLNTFYTIWRLVEPLVKLRYRVKGGLDAETVVVACSDGHVARSNYWFWYDALTTKVRTRLQEEAYDCGTILVVVSNFVAIFGLLLANWQRGHSAFRPNTPLFASTEAPPFSSPPYTSIPFSTCKRASLKTS